MPRYIDADEFMSKFVNEFWSTEISFSSVDDIVEKLVKKAGDVAPVVHAHWIVQEKPVYISNAEYPLSKPTKLYIPDFYTCSMCGRREPYQEPYCHCGAKMDEERSCNVSN